MTKQESKFLAPRLTKQERERSVLLALVDTYLKTGKAVGSHTLQEVGFKNLSTATIRNYFAKLEIEGYLTQQHISGGRVPTDLGLRTYALEYIESDAFSPADEQPFQELKGHTTREIARLLQSFAETLSALTNSAVFLSAPRFDQDIIVSLKLMPIDHARCLCAIVTDFGIIQTEILHTENKLSSFAAKRLEEYFHWRLTGNDKPEHLDPHEELIAQSFYNEVMMRYIVGYIHFTQEKTYQTGFSRLLAYPEFHDPNILGNSLSLFENGQGLRLLLAECTKLNRLKFWIGDDLKSYCQNPHGAVLAIPYYIHQQPVGAVGLLTPSCIPYRQLFKILRAFSHCISQAITRNIYKFKITYRQPYQENPDMLGLSPRALIENKEQNK